jgi:hypothetical protein
MNLRFKLGIHFYLGILHFPKNVQNHCTLMFTEGNTDQVTVYDHW